MAGRLDWHAVGSTHGMVSLGGNLRGRQASVEGRRRDIGGIRSAGRRRAAVSFGSEMHIVGLGGEDQSIEAARRRRRRETAAGVTG